MSTAASCGLPRVSGPDEGVAREKIANDPLKKTNGSTCNAQPIPDDDYASPATRTALARSVT
jgi:hypothetical protein